MNKILFLLIIIFIFSCNNSEKSTLPKAADETHLKDPLLKANQHLVRNEEQLIVAYVARYQLNVTVTGSGLRYTILKHGNGKKIAPGDKVKLEYSLFLLDGTKCYDSSTDRPLEFTVGKGQVVSGLDESMLLFNEGDQAKIIVPSHLAYGLLGDGEKIPARACLVYHLKSIKVIS